MSETGAPNAGQQPERAKEANIANVQLTSEDKAALLDKIRMDMEATRARISRMRKVSKAPVYVPPTASSSSEPSVPSETLSPMCEQVLSLSSAAASDQPSPGSPEPAADSGEPDTVEEIEVDDDGSEVDGPSSSSSSSSVSVSEPASSSPAAISASAAPSSPSVPSESSSAAEPAATPAPSLTPSVPKVELANPVSATPKTAPAPVSALSAPSTSSPASSVPSVSSVSSSSSGGITIPRSSPLGGATTASSSTDPKSKIAQASDLVERLKAARAAAMKNQTGAATTPKPVIAGGSTPVVSSAGAAEGPKPDASIVVNAEGKKVVRVRRGTLVEGAEIIAGLDGPVEVTTNAEGKKVIRVFKKGRTESTSADAAPVIPTPSSQPRMPAGKNIRNLSDLQAAIKKADMTKKQAEAKGKLDNIRSETRARKIAERKTPEERKAIRASRRLTVELQHSETRVKVDAQINTFMMMLQKLESDWQRTEEARIEREKEIEQAKICFERAADQVQYLQKTLQDSLAQIDHLKHIIDRLVDNAPSKIKKEERYMEDLGGFKDNFLKVRHTMFVNLAKHNKAMAKQVGPEDGAAGTPRSAPVPPPMAPGLPPLPLSSVGSSSSSTASPLSPRGGPVHSSPIAARPNPVADLLSQIRSGKQLRHLTEEEIQAEKQSKKGEWRKSVQILQSLQDTLRDALDARHLAMIDDEDEDDDDDDEYWDE